METPTLNQLQDGIRLARAGKKDEARRHLHAVVAAEPAHEMAWLWLASVAEGPLQAVEYLQRVLTLNPNNGHARKGLLNARVQAGIAEAQAGRAASAREHLRAATNEDPRQEVALHWLATVAETPEEAMDCLRRVVEINPQNAGAQGELQRLEAELAPDPAACPLCSTRPTEASPRCPGCGALLSLDDPDALADAKPVNARQMKVAVDHYQKVLAQGPNFAAQHALALAYLNLQQWAEGLGALRTVATLQPANRALRAQFNALLGRRARLEELSRQKPEVAAQSILVVDDSPTVRKLVTLALEKQGYKVVVAADGYQAAQALREGVPNLVLLDIMMPGVDGYQVCKMIKGNRDTARVPVVMLSGKDGFFDKIRGRLAGSTDYITKPFEPAKLLDVVRKYCRTKA
jgi:twitching motility two-component system response regulator PilG